MFDLRLISSDTLSPGELHFKQKTEKTFQAVQKKSAAVTTFIYLYKVRNAEKKYGVSADWVRLPWLTDWTNAEEMARRKKKRNMPFTVTAIPCFPCHEVWIRAIVRHVRPVRYARQTRRTLKSHFSSGMLSPIRRDTKNVEKKRTKVFFAWFLMVPGVNCIVLLKNMRFRSWIRQR